MRRDRQSADDAQCRRLDGNDAHHEELLETLSKEQRTELIGLVNRMVMFQGKRVKVHHAIDRYIASLTSALEKGDAALLKFPAMIPLETGTGSE